MTANNLVAEQSTGVESIIHCFTKNSRRLSRMVGEYQLQVSRGDITPVLFSSPSRMEEGEIVAFLQHATGQFQGVLVANTCSPTSRQDLELHVRDCLEPFTLVDTTGATLPKGMLKQAQGFSTYTLPEPIAYLTLVEAFQKGGGRTLVEALQKSGVALIYSRPRNDYARERHEAWGFTHSGITVKNVQGVSQPLLVWTREN